MRLLLPPASVRRRARRCPTPAARGTHDDQLCCTLLPFPEQNPRRARLITPRVIAPQSCRLRSSSSLRDHSGSGGRARRGRFEQSPEREPAAPPAHMQAPLEHIDGDAELQLENPWRPGRCSDRQARRRTASALNSDVNLCVMVKHSYRRPGREEGLGMTADEGNVCSSRNARAGGNEVSCSANSHRNPTPRRLHSPAALRADEFACPDVRKRAWLPPYEGRSGCFCAHELRGESAARHGPTRELHGLAWRVPCAYGGARSTRPIAAAPPSRSEPP